MNSIQHRRRHAAPNDNDSGPSSANLKVALAYAAAGVPVFPCVPSGPRVKQPLTSHGHHDATTNSHQIRRWWARDPDALVGIPAGAGSGVWVLDVDGAAGRGSLNDLLARLGLASIADLTRCVSQTATGGLHLVFALQPGERPRNRAGDIGAGLDTRGVRADGSSAGYFIAPGSVLPDGRRYEFIDPATLEATGGDATTLANASPAPRNLLFLASFSVQERSRIAADAELRSAIHAADVAAWPALYQQHTSLGDGVTPARIVHHDRYMIAAIDGVVSELAGAMEGARNHALNTAAFRLGQLGIDEAEATKILMPTASAIGLSAHEITRTIRSGVRAGAVNPRGRAVI